MKISGKVSKNEHQNTAGNVMYVSKSRTECPSTESKSAPGRSSDVLQPLAINGDQIALSTYCKRAIKCY
jgi:hypothetical protein